MSPSDPGQHRLPVPPGANGRPPGGRAGARAGAAEADVLLGISRRLDRVERERDELRDGQRAILQRLTRLADAQAEMQRRQGGDDEDDDAWLPSWLLVEDPSAAAEILAELAGWLDDVYLQFRDAELPPCWMWHPGEVAELQWLRERWVEAHRGKKSWSGVQEWFEKRAAVVKRLADLQRCDLAEHVDGGKARRRKAAAMRSAIEVLGGMWAASKDLPIPTAEQLDESSRTQHPTAAGPPDIDD